MRDLRIDKLIPTRQLVITKFYPNIDVIPDGSWVDPSDTSITEKEWIDENVFNKSYSDQYYESERKVIDDILDDGKIDGSNGNDQLGPFNPDFDHDTKSDKSKESPTSNPSTDPKNSSTSTTDQSSTYPISSINSNTTQAISSRKGSTGFQGISEFTPQEEEELSMSEIDSVFK